MTKNTKKILITSCIGAVTIGVGILVYQLLSPKPLLIDYTSIVDFYNDQNPTEFFLIGNKFKKGNYPKEESIVFKKVDSLDFVEFSGSFFYNVLIFNEVDFSVFSDHDFSILEDLISKQTILVINYCKSAELFIDKGFMKRDISVEQTYGYSKFYLHPRGLKLICRRFEYTITGEKQSKTIKYDMLLGLKGVINYYK